MIYKRRARIKAILAWCSYDWGIAPFSVIVTTFVFATYFTSKIAVNEVVGTHQWGNAMALSGILIAILSPISGAIAEYHGKRKLWLGLFTSLIIIGSALLWYAYPNPASSEFTLFCVILGTIGANVSMVFYNALLPTLAPANYLGRISGWGWGAGYLGGLVVLMIALGGFIEAKTSWLHTETFEQIRICGPLVAIWTIIFTLPLFFTVSDTQHKKHCGLRKAIRYGLKDLLVTIRNMPRQKNILTFLVAQMIYIDGLNTLFAFGGIFAAGTFQMNFSEILLLGVLMNAFAGVGSILLAWVDDWLGSKFMIMFSLIALIILGAGMVCTTSKSLFWVLACFLSLFVGPLQSSSRSLMTQIVPEDKMTELFGFYVLSGKVSMFIGPWVLGAITLQFNSQRVGMGAILSFFIVGAIILYRVQSNPGK